MKILIIFVGLIIIWKSDGLSPNITSTSPLHRLSKRYLSYPVNGGSAKCVFGMAWPVMLGSKQSLSFGVNLQGQYVIPADIITWYKKFNGDFLKRTRRTIDDHHHSNKNVRDTSRQMFYFTIESVLNRYGRNGRECLLRAICEAAETPLKHNGMFGELLDAILTPEFDELPQVYFDAKHAGYWGADCQKIYNKCPKGKGILENFSFLE